jgi:hypothetical protein
VSDCQCLTLIRAPIRARRRCRWGGSFGRPSSSRSQKCGKTIVERLSPDSVSRSTASVAK